MSDVRLRKQIADAFIAVDALDRLAEENAGADDFDFGDHFFRGKRNAVGDDQAVDRSVGDALDRGAAKDAVRGGDVDFAGTLLTNDAGRAGDAAAGADHVIEHEGDFSLDRSADQVRLFGFFGRDAAFVHDGERCAEARSMAESAFDAAFVRADHDDVILGKAHHFEVLIEHGCPV